MKKIGGYLFFFGIGSIILSFFNLEFIVLSWIDSWGQSTGWEIRIGLAVVGAGLWLFANQFEGSAATR